jgi:predicted transposase/invertase (TIGR01784 family)
MRRLYERGMPDQEIRTMYEFIDWTMILPEALEDKFWHELKTFEESQKMAYVTNAERIGIKKGIEQGMERKARDLALKMLREGLEVETIARITDLSIEQLQQLQAQ